MSWHYNLISDYNLHWNFNKWSRKWECVGKYLYNCITCKALAKFLTIIWHHKVVAKAVKPKPYSHVNILHFIVDLEVECIIIPDQCILFEWVSRFFVFVIGIFACGIQHLPLLIVGISFFFILLDSVWLSLLVRHLHCLFECVRIDLFKNSLQRNQTLL